MKIADLFETRVEEKIEPVIKVGERSDEHKLASEIGSYVVTPTIEAFLDDMLEHYTDTFLNKTTEIGIWISGYFGSGKSHFAKILVAARGQPCPGRRPGEQTVRVACSSRRAAANLHSSQPFPRRQLRNQCARLQSQHARG